MSDIVKAQFHGDTIEAIHGDGTAWVVVRPVCESLRISPQGQFARLNGAKWATIKMILTVAEDGKAREQLCIRLDKFPMWLATIQPSRVRAEVRAKLEAYQNECAEVLYEHFFGPRNKAANDGAIAMMAEAIALLTDRVRQLESGGGIISPQQREEIRYKAAEIARKRVLAGHAKSRLSASSSVYATLGGAVGWGGAGCKWDDLPVAKFPDAKAELARMHGYVEGVLATQNKAKQISLFDALKGRAA